MKKFLVVVLFLSIAPVISATMFPKVYLADGQTPLEYANPNIPFVYRDIMVGTKLTIVLESNTTEFGGGGALVLADANMGYAVLSGRDFDGFSYAGSCLPAAGDFASAYDLTYEGVQGIDLYTDFPGVPGDWFVVDYNAVEVGNCGVEVYQYQTTFPPSSELINYLEFTHVPTRDFNGDHQVNFVDFSILASYWRQTGFDDPNDCQGADLDLDHDVDVKDLKLFMDFWLEKTE